jgi:hypothetical protein
LAPLAVGIQLHLLIGQLRLPLAQFEDQLLLSLTRAKEVRVIPRGLISQKKEENEKKK